MIDGSRIDRLHKVSQFENLKKEATFFSHMITYAPYTLASMSSIFTGMYGCKNGINAYYKMFQHPKENCKTLAEYLSENGWYTQGDAMRLSLVSNRGFKKLTEQEENVDFAKVHGQILDKILDNKEKDQPFFAYLHYPKIHHSIKEHVFDKYDDFSHEYFENKEKNLQNYDNYLQEAGNYLEKILEKINSYALEENSLIVVMTDHGMGVGEKIGERAYGIFTYEYSIRTFAYFIQPKLFPKGKEIYEVTRTIDVMPTILEALGIRIDNNCLKIQGESLLGLTRNQDCKGENTDPDFGRFAFAETGGLNGPWPSPKLPNVKCIRTKEWKLIHNLTPNTWELYNILADPHEQKNLIDEQPVIFTKLKTRLEKIVNDYEKQT